MSDEILRAAHARLQERKTAVVEGAAEQVEGEVHDVSVFAPLFVGTDVAVVDLDRLLAAMIQANWSHEPEVLELLASGQQDTVVRMLTMVKGFATDAFLLGVFAAEERRAREAAQGA